MYYRALCQCIWMTALFVNSTVSQETPAPTKASKDKSRPTLVRVGNFPIKLEDEDLIQRVKSSDDDIRSADCLNSKVFDYWLDNLDLQPNEDVTLNGFAHECQLNASNHEHLLAVAKANLNSKLELYNDNATELWNSTYIDLSYTYRDALEATFPSLIYQHLAAYLGVGWLVNGTVAGVPARCDVLVNEALGAASEWDKLGMGAATTLMALVPTFLAFGNLYVPRSSEAFATSSLIGLSTALFSLGLPVKSLSSVPNRRKLDLSILGVAALKKIELLGTLPKTPSGHQLRLQELWSWTRDNPGVPYKEDFAEIAHQARTVWKQRRHLWHIPAILIAAGQVVMFVLAISPLLSRFGIPKFIFSCFDRDNTWSYTTGLYLLISAVISAVFRCAMWQFAHHECLYAYSLSQPAIRSLEDLVQKNDPHDVHTTKDRLPPLYPPLISSFRKYRLSVSDNPESKVLKPWTWSMPDLKAPSEHPRSTGFGNLAQAIKSFFSVRTWQSGFQASEAARRFRPLIVLTHLSTEGRFQLLTLFTGFIEAFLLFILTFFFAAQWGGNLYLTAWAVGFLLLWITVGRAVSILYVTYSSRVWGLQVINCDTRKEILGCLRILCSMKYVLVKVNGAHYFNGHRLDFHGDFNDWILRYNAGEFDVDKVMAGKNLHKDQELKDLRGSPIAYISYDGSSTSRIPLLPGEQAINTLPLSQKSAFTSTDSIV